MVSTAALPPTARLDPSVPAAPTATSDRFASPASAPDHSEPSVRPRVRRLVVFTGKLS